MNSNRYLVKNLRLGVGEDIGALRKRAAKVLKIKESDIKDISLVKRSLDARKKNDIHYVCSAAVTAGNALNAELYEEIVYGIPKVSFDGLRPVIAGFGPAGMFAGLVLSKAGLMPLILERGGTVEERTEKVEAFRKGEAPLDTECNVQFGEGGAGTFSDGKLYTGNKNKGGYFTEVLNTFHRFGAAPEITYDAKPHIGTDVLKTVIKNMRDFIIESGGEVRFSTRLEGIDALGDGSYKLYVASSETGEQSELITKTLILAIGHSARDTMRMLIGKGFNMQQKPYAIGLRVEHKRETIDRAMYGEMADKLPAADYKLTYHAENGRPVFSFCMCPGGYVVNSSSTPGQLVINGMSYSGRNGENSNTAMIVGITPDDFEGESPEDAIKYQEKLEKEFYNLADGLIPVQRLEDFKAGEETKALGHITPQIKGQYTLSEISHILPVEVRDALRESFESFGRTIEGYDDPDTILSGIESRTSSPVRINRDENMMAEGYPGILPIGEGAGYAGGITSAAADGIKAAEKAAEYIIRN